MCIRHNWFRRGFSSRKVALRQIFQYTVEGKMLSILCSSTYWFFGSLPGAGQWKHRAHVRGRQMRCLCRFHNENAKTNTQTPGA